MKTCFMTTRTESARASARRQARDVPRPGHHSSRGSAVLIVLTLISAMALIVLANCTTLYWMKREILRIEERQQRVRLTVRAPRPGPAAAPKPDAAPKPGPKPAAP